MKFFKRFFMAMLLIGVLSTSTILCACNPNDRPTEQPSGAPSGNDEIIEPYTLSLTRFYLKDQNPYISDYFDDESKLNIAEKINSVEELKSFCEEKHLKVFDETDTTLKSDNVSKKLKEYDEKFFSKRSIVLIFRFNETADHSTYDSVDIKDGVMTVNLVTANGNATTEVRTHIRIFEISKTVAKDINQIKVKESIGELDQKVGIQIFNDLVTIKSVTSPPIINSSEELSIFKDFSIYEDVSIETIERFIALLEKYDNDYFQNKSLILIFRGNPSSEFYKVKSFDIKDDLLNITLSTPKSDGYIPIPWPILTCAYMFEIDRDQVAAVTKINVTQIEE
ncbi:MAG: hypothetical protein K2O35_05415 [Clostridia bacterium]|nr:hypothetical protein [Clostridia bacterium]